MTKLLTPIKAIRAKCMDCSCYQPKEIRLCPVTNCPLWPYRMGRRPSREENIEQSCEGQEQTEGVEA
ncbi:MAG: hypothetical protein FJY85_05815 [Deltaproteobacteria bacterium]|nr:hypothetical protein [Deltaproteobacteria bacterium]